MPKGGKRGHRKGPTAVPPSVSPYNVLMTKSAEAVYAEMHKKAKEAEDRGDFGNAHCTAFNMVRDALRNFIPANPIDKRYALTGDLSNIFRLQKGRMRICWIASSRQRAVCILFISETLRKAGDANDPYVLFAGMVMSGQYNQVFEMLGVKPPVKVVSSPPIPSVN
jgi:hypothetical protein